MTQSSTTPEQRADRRLIYDLVTVGIQMGLPVPNNVSYSHNILIIHCESDDTWSVERWAMFLRLPTPSFERDGEQPRIQKSNGRTYRTYGTGNSYEPMDHPDITGRWLGQVWCCVFGDGVA